MKYKRIGIILFVTVLFLAVLSYVCINKLRDNTIEINIGYQSVTSQTWGALILKNLKIYEKKLSDEFPEKKIKVIWHDEISGAVINTNMIAGKMDIGFMGDMPMLLNMYKSKTIEKYDSTCIALDGKGKGGKNQGIVVSKDSPIHNIYDMNNKNISVPVGSSAHFMLMKVLEKYELLDKVQILHHDVSFATHLLKENKTDAFAIWAPYANHLSREIGARVLIDGIESKVDYLAGVMINNNLLKKDERFAKIFKDSLDEAHRFIKNNKEKVAEILKIETGFDYEVCLKEIEEIEEIEWNSKITKEDVQTLKEKMMFLNKLEKLKSFDLENNLLLEEDI